VSTCGGLFWSLNAGQKSLDTQDLIDGQEVPVPFNNSFRCSSDRLFVAGTTTNSPYELYAGAHTATKVASLPKGGQFTFNISPDGSRLAYYSGVSHQLCMVSDFTSTQCASRETSDSSGDILSVNNAGEVLTATTTPGGCLYKTATNFVPVRPPATGDDACLGIGYWKPGTSSFQIIEPIGRSPQWISPGTAELLRNWSRR